MAGDDELCPNLRHLGVPWRKHAILEHIWTLLFLTEHVLQPSFQLRQFYGV
jgi:hypothetical protein